MTGPGTVAGRQACGSGSLIEAVRDRTKTVGLKQVNAVLMQPHWRQNSRDEPEQPFVVNTQKAKSK